MEPKSFRIRIYWSLWLAVVALALLPRFTVFLRAAPDNLFALACTYAVGTWLSVMVLNLIEGHRLYSYLKTNRPELWRRLTEVPFLGEGYNNPLQLFRWLTSKDDGTDAELNSRRLDYRRFLEWVLTVFFSCILLMPILLGF